MFIWSFELTFISWGMMNLLLTKAKRQLTKDWLHHSHRLFSQIPGESLGTSPLNSPRPSSSFSRQSSVFVARKSDENFFIGRKTVRRIADSRFSWGLSSCDVWLVESLCHWDGIGLRSNTLKQFQAFPKPYATLPTAMHNLEGLQNTVHLGKIETFCKNIWFHQWNHFISLQSQIMRHLFESSKIWQHPETRTPLTPRLTCHFKNTIPLAPTTTTATTTRSTCHSFSLKKWLWTQKHPPKHPNTDHPLRPAPEGCLLAIAPNPPDVPRCRGCWLVCGKRRKWRKTTKLTGKNARRLFFWPKPSIPPSGMTERHPPNRGLQVFNVPWLSQERNGLGLPQKVKARKPQFLNVFGSIGPFTNRFFWVVHVFDPQLDDLCRWGQPCWRFNGGKGAKTTARRPVVGAFGLRRDWPGFWTANSNT